MWEEKKVIGIDIGGTKVHVGLVQHGKVLKEVRLSTSAKEHKAHILSEISDAVAEVMEPGVAGIGVGVPGLVDEEQGIVHNVLNIPSWREVHLKAHLEETFKIPVLVTNDANSFAAGEKIYGKGKPYKNMAGITLGTGFGTGIIIDSRLYSGLFSSAGEFGGIPYLDQTLEDYCSGKFFLNKHGIPGARVQELAEQGDSKALAILEEYGHHLGNGIKVILYAISPEAIIFGGSVCGCFPYFKEAMERSIETFPFKIVTDKLVIDYSSINNAAVLGAAALFSVRHTGSLTKSRAEVV